MSFITKQPPVALAHAALLMALAAFALLLLGLAPMPARAAGATAADGGVPVVRVGPGRAITTLRQAARVAKSGSIVEIDAGDYRGDVAVWRQHDLLIRGVGGRARVFANGRSAQDKAVWVITGDRVVVENVELSGARVPDHNGAGIRYEGADLTLRHCRLHHNEMGLLAIKKPRGRIYIEDCEVDHNQTDTARHGKLGHNLYIGAIASFTLYNSYVHDGSQGHLVKSRARVNYIAGNRLLDRDGSSSYLIDLPNGGRADISNNRLWQGRDAANMTAIAFAAEHGREAPGQRLRVTDNVFDNDARVAVFVRNFSVAEAQLRGNQVPLLTVQLVGAGDVD